MDKNKCVIEINKKTIVINNQGHEWAEIQTICAFKINMMSIITNHELNPTVFNIYNH